jgi:hypothetical protein
MWTCPTCKTNIYEDICHICGLHESDKEIVEAENFVDDLLSKGVPPAKIEEELMGMGFDTESAAQMTLDRSKAYDKSTTAMIMRVNFGGIFGCVLGALIALAIVFAGVPRFFLKWIIVLGVVIGGVGGNFLWSWLARMAGSGSTSDDHEFNDH